jgi:toxin ParE1/3/4
MKILITDYAKEELHLIYEYYSIKASIKVASKIKKDIISAIKNIAINPLMFQIEENLTELGKQHRRSVDGNYKIIYRVENETIYITDIFDARRNPENMNG